MLDSVLTAINQAQMQNGLRNGDYLRYSQYCSRRLSRLRRSLGLTHGKRGFQKVVLDGEKVTDPRAVFVPLISAERCWAYSMFLKEDPSQDPARVRFHVRRRLAKAVTFTNRFFELCKILGDERTKIEAEAHHNWMSANAALDSSSWEEALKCFRQAKALFEKLAMVGAVEEDTKLYRQRVEDIEPVIRFCVYNLRREGISDGAGAEDIMDIDQSVGSDVLLRSKLDTAIEQHRRKQAETMEAVSWRGASVPVRSDKIRVCILDAQAASIKAAETGEHAKRMEAFDKVFISLNDALAHLRTEALAAISDKAQISHLDVLKAFLTHELLIATVQRDRAMTDELRSRMDQQSSGAQGSGKNKYASGKPVLAEDLISMYDRLIQSLNEFRGVAGYQGSSEEGCVEVATAVYQGLRCYYLALAYNTAEKWSEAGALFARAGEYVPIARAALKGVNTQELQQLVGASELEWLEKQAQVGASVPRAMALLKAQETEQSLSKVKALSLSDQAEHRQPIGLLERVHEYSSTSDVPHLISFPPALRPMPVKPILFDLAFDDIRYPDLTQRMPKRRKGLLGAFF